ncbi:MAG: SEC-C metal-binding domain-containing protein, partial [Candidatus Omnitrophota bacterium]|jgi:preprotein translocase subunit SecA
MNKQREVIYAERRSVLEGKELHEYIAAAIENGLDGAMDRFMEEKLQADEWDFKGLDEWFRGKLGFALASGRDEIFMGSRPEIRERLLGIINKHYEKREFILGADVARHIEKTIMLDMIDSKWKEHLYAMDGLKEGIGLRAYGQVDPLIEYKNEGFAMFEEMMNRIQDDALEFVFKVQVVGQEKPKGVFDSVPQQMIHRDMGSLASRIPNAGAGQPAEASPQDAKQLPIEREAPKVGRNDPCPCGSGKKYKKCCGA